MKRPDTVTAVSLIAGLLGLVLLLSLHTFPVLRDLGDIRECQSVDWITDTCVESQHYWRYNQ